MFIFTFFKNGCIFFSNFALYNDVCVRDCSGKPAACGHRAAAGLVAESPTQRSVWGTPRKTTTLLNINT